MHPPSSPPNHFLRGARRPDRRTATTSPHWLRRGRCRCNNNNSLLLVLLLLQLPLPVAALGPFRPCRGESLRGQMGQALYRHSIHQTLFGRTMRTSCRLPAVPAVDCRFPSRDLCLCSSRSLFSPPPRPQTQNPKETIRAAYPHQRPARPHPLSGNEKKKQNRQKPPTRPKFPNFDRWSPSPAFAPARPPMLLLLRPLARRTS
mmetsp:Transcript_71666/g.155958  ORF Transcript_71666/g.155958 Transcript_71666/m.155958 type:complete len:203 (-) Transcript_71666:530-1138(-)